MEAAAGSGGWSEMLGVRMVCTFLAGTHTFTAERKAVNGITYAPKYEVQSWNGKSGNWEKISSGSGGSCLLIEADSTLPRRIVWKWFKEGFSVIVR